MLQTQNTSKMDANVEGAYYEERKVYRLIIMR